MIGNGTLNEADTRDETDAEARQRAAVELDTTFLVEAGAGTGKTGVLLQRVLRMIRTGRSRLERVAAVTFTEKAASELRMRLRVEIDILLASTLSDEEHRHLWAARLQLERASIATVHAFCSALLRERPLEAGVDPNFTILDTFGTRVLQTETWHEWLAQEMEHGPNVVKTALRAGLSLKHFEALRDFLVEQRDCLSLLAEPVDSPLPIFRPLFQQVFARLVRLQSACTDETDRAYAQIGRVQEYVEQIEHQVEREQQPETGGTTGDELGWERLLFHALPVQKRAGNKANWKPAETLTEVRACFHDLLEAHTHARAAWVHNHTLGLVQWLSGYLRAYDKKKQDQGCLDFTDLLLYTRDVLADNLEVRQYFQNKFDFLLIDEFQDTDPLQAEIVFFLAEQQPRAKEWTETVLKPGKLFLVGDPHQSIYRFRRADLAVYNLVRTAIERQGAVIALSMNFRTRAPILNWINTTFDRAFNHTQEGVSEVPVYRPLVAARQEEIQRQAEDQNIQDQTPEQTGPHGPAILPLPIPTNLLSHKPARQEIRMAEAQTVAAYLQQAVADTASHVRRELSEDSEDGELNYRDIAVLFRTHRAMDAYEEAFRQAGIPYQVLGGRQYVSRLEIEELRVLLRAIERPSDRVAVVATLRSSMGGFSDEELTAFVSSGGSFQYTVDTTVSVPASLPGAARFQAAFALLRDLHARSRQASPAQLLYHMYNQTHLVPLFALHQHGAQRVANLLKLIDLAQALSAQGLRTLGAFNRFLAEHESAAQEGEAVIAEDHEPAVRFLTIHKAKGLEFSVVILADAVPSSDRSSRLGLIERTHRESRLELQLGPRALHWTTHGWHDAQAREKVREAAEERRLWYVAATRVRNHLILPLVPHLSSLEETGSKSLWSIFHGGDEALPQVVQTVEVVQEASDVSFVSPIQAGESVPKIGLELLQLFTQIPTDEVAYRAYQTWQEDQYALRDTARDSRALTDVTALLTETGDLAQVGSRVATRQVSRRLGKAVATALQKGWKTGEKVPIQNRQACMIATEGEATEDTKGAKDTEHLVRNFLAAPSMARAQAAEERFADVPFSLHYKKLVQRADCLLDGVVDFAFLEDNAWVILGLKTDTIPDEEAQRERLQLGVYALAFEELTAYPVKELIIVFACSSQDICFAWNAAARSAVQAFLLDSLNNLFWHNT